MLKTKVPGKLDESKLASVQSDNLLRARESKRHKWTCMCGWPVVPGHNCEVSALSGQATCPRCKMEQYDPNQTNADRERARAAITGSAQRQQPPEARNQRVEFPEHRLFTGCKCYNCETNLSPVSIVRDELKEIRCGCGLTHDNRVLASMGTEVTDSQALYNFFGPMAMVEVETKTHVGYGNPGRV